MAIEFTPEDREAQVKIRQVLRNLREGQLLSQRDVSARLEMAQGNFNRLEGGSNDLKLVTIAAWARALGYSLDIRLIPMEDADEFDIALRQVFG